MTSGIYNVCDMEKCKNPATRTGWLAGEEIDICEEHARARQFWAAMRRWCRRRSSSSSRKCSGDERAGRSLGEMREAGARSLVDLVFSGALPRIEVVAGRDMTRAPPSDARLASIRKAMRGKPQDAKGKVGPRPRTGVHDEEPLTSRIVTDAELRKVGGWK